MKRNAIAAREAPGENTSSETLASIAYQRLRSDIINARREPGGKLRVQELSEHYGVGPSPIREALNRLSRDGLVTLSDRRGFSVTPVSCEGLDELTRTRCWLNELALRQAIANGDAAWEENIVLAYHRLTRLPRYIDAGSGLKRYNPDWELAHRTFHSALIAACGSRWLLAYCEQLFDAGAHYRHLSRVSSMKRAQRRDEHRQILDASVARDADGAVALLTRHVTRTAELVRERLGAPGTTVKGEPSSRQGPRRGT
ncbi:MAG: FCD domain-containing protein [Burkholderiales bacterium]|nr:FCD domain-containing protein [Burkholderiales bacterium]